MDSIDFDIANYTDDELYQLVDLPIDATKEQIYNSTNEFIQKYIKSNKPMYYNFFIAVQNRLLAIWEEKTVEDENEKGGSFIKTEYEPNHANDKDLVNRSDFTKIVPGGDNHIILRRERLPVGQGTGVPFVQGQMNPTLRNMKKQLVNIDSHYRALIRCQTTAATDCSGIICPSGNMVFADSSTDFTFNLSQPIKHVLKMSLYSYEIPHSWYVFSEDYGTASFGVAGECIDISAGNYDSSGLIHSIQTVIDTIPALGITISLNPINNKVTFSHPSTAFDLIFYDSSGQIYDCSKAPCGTHGAKLDYNLGWLLGFRQPSYSGATSYTGESLIDTYGFRYLFLELDDFNSNRLNQGVISLDANLNKFNYPASTRCTLPVAEAPLSSSACGKGPPSWQGAPLTANETYRRAQLLNARNRGFPDRYLSPVNSDVLARIPVRKFNNYDILFDNWNSGLEDTAREYFGPVTLKRMHVRLLNDKGYVVNLNNMNFSFSLIVEHLYQY
jgi:hypothetical protein